MTARKGEGEGAVSGDSTSDALAAVGSTGAVSGAASPVGSTGAVSGATSPVGRGVSRKAMPAARMASNTLLTSASDAVGAL